MKPIFTTIIVLTAFAMGVQVGHKRASKPYFDKPFSIFLEEVTEADLAACRKDENCMDMSPMTDLPLREDMQINAEMYLDQVEGKQN